MNNAFTKVLIEVSHEAWAQLCGWFKAKSWWKLILIIGGGSVLLGSMCLGLLFLFFSFQVPDFRGLADYKPAQISRVYAHDGALVAEFARERRIYTPIKDIPKELIEAYLAAEDSSFFAHQGFDPRGIIRAALVNTFTDRKQGASTITQQVAKTFLLSSERTYSRKIKELILAYRIEKAFTKEEILELYLNQIYLGAGAYGVTAAATTYFGKSLEELTIGQRALLAGLPKAPSAFNPLRNPDNARTRRDFIIRRMQEEGYITALQADKAIATDLELAPTSGLRGNEAPDFAELIRREMISRFGEQQLFEHGYIIQSTLDLEMQQAATKAVINGVRAYDRRHGYRGPLEQVATENWQDSIKQLQRKYAHMSELGAPAIVLSVSDKNKNAQAGLSSGKKVTLPFEGLRWARAYKNADALGPEISKPSEVLKVGDVVLVRRMSDLPEFKDTADANNKYSLEQWPVVQAALVALDAQTGAIRAMVGGFDGVAGQFNRATQAQRQVGSAFKPFVYASALEQGYTNASVILDAPLVLDGGESGEWRPQNYSNEIYGPSTLRRGLEESRNLMTIRLARDLGINRIIDKTAEYGLNTRNMQRHDLSTALGTTSLSLLEMTTAYSVFANQGQKVQPYFIAGIQDVTGKQLYKAHEGCQNCAGPASNPAQLPRPVELNAVGVVSPVVAYQMVELLRGVVQRGTGTRAKAVGHPVAGKTGTTNDYVDAWFIGFSADLVTGVWIGFDSPTTLGNNETGGRAALPIWTEFMRDALRQKPVQDFDVPPGVTFVTVDADTGELPSAASTNTLLEVFPRGQEPTTVRANTFWGTEQGGTGPAPTLETQGIY